MTELEPNAIAEALGASRVIDLDAADHGPIELLALRREVSERLQSSGGRPSDPSWTISRQVPFNELHWKRLQKLAGEVGSERRRVGAAQLAAILVERGLDEIEEDRWRDVLVASREQPPRIGAEAAEAAGISYRQLDAWCKEGLVHPVEADGRNRWFDDDAVVAAIAMRRLHTAERRIVVPPSVRDLSARYLLATDDGLLRGLETMREVSVALARVEGGSVVDQLPVRLRLLGWPHDPDEEGIDSGDSAKAL